MNLTKEEHIIHSHTQAARIKSEGVKVDGRDEAEDVKLLGITINQNFRFTKHTNITVSKVNYRLAHVAKLRKYLTDRHFKMVMESLVTSVLQWGLELAGKDRTNLRKLQKCQNSILRLLTDSDRRMSVRLMLQRTNMLNVQNMTSLEDVRLKDGVGGVVPFRVASKED